MKIWNLYNKLDDEVLDIAEFGYENEEELEV